MDFLKQLGLDSVSPGSYAGEWLPANGREELVSVNPATGEAIGTVLQTNEDDYETVVQRAHETWKSWRMVPSGYPCSKPARLPLICLS